MTQIETTDTSTTGTTEQAATPPAKSVPRNVIVFGETGVGKSTLINMILDTNLAPTSSGARGCTFKSDIYSGSFEGLKFNFYDTVGLGEYSSGMIQSSQAIKNLYQLVKRLAHSGGVHLLVFVIKCGRITETMEKNYALFFRAFCEEKLPIIIAVNACENVDPMDSWWEENEEAFVAAKMVFDGHACVCGDKGRWIKRSQCYANADLIEESREVLRTLIVEQSLKVGWRKPTLSWFRSIFHTLFDFFSKVPWAYKNLYNRLLESFTEDEAEQIIESVKNSDEEAEKEKKLYNGLLGSFTKDEADQIIEFVKNSDAEAEKEEKSVGKVKKVEKAG